MYLISLITLYEVVSTIILQMRAFHVPVTGLGTEIQQFKKFLPSYYYFHSCGETEAMAGGGAAGKQA